MIETIVAVIIALVLLPFVVQVFASVFMLVSEYAGIAFVWCIAIGALYFVSDNYRETTGNTAPGITLNWFSTGVFCLTALASLIWIIYDTRRNLRDKKKQGANVSHEKSKAEEDFKK